MHFDMQLMHSKIWAGACAALLSGMPMAALAQDSATPMTIAPVTTANEAKPCLEQGNGFLRARLSGSIRAELGWDGPTLECSGASRPGGGVRLRFSHAFGDKDQQLVLLFGIGRLREGEPARNLPVNVTIIRQGAGQFFGTQGNDSCTIDDLRQEPLAGIPLRNRSYRVIARGFCIKPTPAIRGDGAVLITRFDFAGRVDFSEEDTQPDNTLAHSNDRSKTSR
jgi:hypothetical protein